MSYFNQKSSSITSSYANDIPLYFGTSNQSWFEYDTTGTVSGLTNFTDGNFIIKSTSASGVALSGTLANAPQARLIMVSMDGNFMGGMYQNGSNLFIESAYRILLAPSKLAGGSRVVHLGDGANTGVVNIAGASTSPNQIQFGALCDSGGNIIGTTNGSGLVITSPRSGGRFIHINGANQFNVTAITGTYTALTTDNQVSFTAYTGGSTLNLPDAASYFASATKVQFLTVKDEAGTANTNVITIDASGTQTIDGTTTKTINAAYGMLKLYCNGTAWFTV